VSAHEIDRTGIVKATRKAMRKAIGNANQRLHDRIQYLLIDAFYLPYTRGIKMPAKSYRRNKKYTELSGSNGRQKAIIKGDRKSFSIASASIIAKVYRDNLMIKLGKRKKYIKYGWEENKGYGTKKHVLSIEKYGSNYLHRKTFIKSLVS
jgi:ribonuclease HII